MSKSKLTIIILAAVFLSMLLATSGCRSEVSKASYEKRVVNVLKEVGDKLGPNLEKMKKLSPDKEKEKESLDKEQVEILKDSRDKITKISAPDDFFSGHSNLVEFFELLISYREDQIKAAKVKKPGSEDIEKRQKLQEDYQMVTLAFTRVSSELSFLQYEMRNAFYDLLRYQSQSGF